MFHNLNNQELIGLNRFVFNLKESCESRSSCEAAVVLFSVVSPLKRPLITVISSWSTLTKETGSLWKNTFQLGLRNISATMGGWCGISSHLV